MKFIRSIIAQGTWLQADVLINKHIRFANAISVVLGLVILQNAMIGLYYHVWPLLIIQAIHILAISVVPLFNRYGKRLLASIWFSVTATSFVSLYGILYTIDTNVIFYIPLTIFLVFLFPAAEKRYVYMLVGYSLLCFIAVALYHSLHIPRLFYMPQGFLDMQRLNSLMGLPFLSFVFGLYAFTTINRAEGSVASEKDKTEHLLLNILPRAVAERFKNDQSFLAESFDSVTVLFADIVGFTKFSDKLRPDVVVIFLNQLFSQFDQLIERYGLEKIKTIGDAYMVAGGVPTPSTDHVGKMCEVALAMQQIAAQMETPTGEQLHIRIGINTGPATAGVIGVRKFIYDLWGDMVNTASRMESHGEADTIQITEDVYEIVKEEFDCTPRGIIPVKGKGAMATYFLLGKRAAKAEDSIAVQDSYC